MKKIVKKYLCPECGEICNGIYKGIHTETNYSKCKGKMVKMWWHSWKCSKCGCKYMADAPKNKKEKTK
jgi:hypothetical protein